MDVSVIIATLNSAATLRAAIQSVIDQRGVEVEILIADGASRDDTLAICASFGEALVSVVSQPDDSLYAAWNGALPMVRGQWVMFLGSDDRLASPTVLAELVRFTNLQSPTTRIVYGAARYITADGRILGDMGEPWPVARAAMRHHNSIPHTATLHRRDLFENGKGFDASFRIAGDYELLRRETRLNGAAFAPSMLVVLAGANGLTADPRQHLRHVLEKGRIFAAQDGRRPLHWRLGLAKALARRAILIVAGQGGLAAYGRLKRALGAEVTGLTSVP
ncbi:glycosyltransferase family 2 protein [soil metagenome]